MAAFEIITRQTAIFRITDDVSSTHDVTNNTPATMVAGVLVTVSAGRQYPTQHIDLDTAVVVKPGETVTLDPTTVTGAVGIGFNDTKEQATSTIDEFVVA